ncbi:uncharacterized protein LOC107626551 [Arachis ipaensis]|uniref:uncharacterized protein LOC107626551 n=1 Tax=Arachis ipaensis TaxID=130454 RepID=UPI0007AFBA29|nr:uncharacterized protein LOC107626551 [Arachis ipaensis]XP_025635224.1 uncharacterized protein LOC112729064 [Arachis hypogaea]
MCHHQGPFRATSLARTSQQILGGHIQQWAPPSNDNNSAAHHSQDKEHPSSTKSDQPRGIINCISGGFVGGGATSSAREHSYRAMLSIEASQDHPQTPSHFFQITFQSFDFNTTITNFNDPVVISIQLGDLLVKKVLLDPGRNIDVIFHSTSQKIKLSNNMLQPSIGDLVSFSGERVPVLGSVWFQTTLGEVSLSKTSDIQYLVVDRFSTYNLILGRPFLNRFGAIVSTIYLYVKFPLQDDTIATIYSDARKARECYNNSFK